MRFNDDFKHPRLYVDLPLAEEKPIALNEDQIHYLKNVMRRENEDKVRLFNGRDGEWLATLNFENKKRGSATPRSHFKPQPEQKQPVHLLFAPLKKSPMLFLIEKAVELGVTDLYPIISDRTENRKINEERLHKHIIEASEQCERLLIPNLHPIERMTDLVAQWNQDTPIHWCAERLDGTQTIQESSSARAYLIGPEGGFNDREHTFLEAQAHVIPIDLGEQILRAETAALYCLAHTKLNIENT